MTGIGINKQVKIMTEIAKIQTKISYPDKSNREELKSNIAKGATAAGTGTATVLTKLYAEDMFVKMPKGDKGISLEQILAKDPLYKSGIEIEFFRPKGKEKMEFISDVAERMYGKGNFVLEPIFQDKGGINAPQVKQIKPIMEKILQGQKVTQEDSKFLDSVNKYISKTTDNGSGFKLYKKLPQANKEGQVFERVGHFIQDNSFNPWHRGIEFVTEPLKTKEQLREFTQITDTMRSMEPKVGPLRRVGNFFNNLRTQFAYALSGADKNDLSGFESSKLKVPGYQGDKMAVPGYGSIHLHHDAEQMMVKKNPLSFINEINLYNKWAPFVENTLDPGLSRRNFCQPHEMAFIEDLNKKIVPQIMEMTAKGTRELSQEQNTKVWDNMANLFLDHYDSHTKVKYRNLNITNELGEAIQRIGQDRELPACLKGVIGKKSKTTMELRISQSTLNPKRILTLNTFVHNMAKKAEEASLKGEVLDYKPLAFKPWQQNKTLRSFVETFSRPENPMSFTDWKKMRTPLFDRAFFDNLLCLNTRHKLQPIGYEEVNLTTIQSSLKNLKNVAVERLKLIKEPEVKTALALGVTVSAGTSVLLNMDKFKKHEKTD